MRQQTFFILLVFNVVSTFGKEINNVSYEEFYLEEDYQKTKRCKITITIIEEYLSIKFLFRPEQLSFRFNLKDVLEVDTEKHQISFTILMYMIWKEPQVRCRKAVKHVLTFTLFKTFLFSSRLIFHLGVSGKVIM